MTAECTAQPIVLQAENDRALVARFDGGTICSDARVILLKEVEQATGIIRQFAACFTDHRNPDLIDHTLYELIAQRVYALALGYEDLNDHDSHVRTCCWQPWWARRTHTRSRWQARVP